MRTVGLAVALAACSAAALAQPGPPPGCDTPQSHQLDFWVGKWEVRPTGKDKVVAHSLIEKKYGGCAIRENWMPLGRELTGGGGSLSLYDTHSGKWRQTWIDSSGVRADFDGGYADGVMTIAGPWPDFNGPGKDALVRIRYKLQGDRQVRQWGEASSDGGKTWVPAFDFLYRRVTELPSF